MVSLMREASVGLAIDIAFGAVMRRSSVLRLVAKFLRAENVLGIGGVAEDGGVCATALMRA